MTENKTLSVHDLTKEARRRIKEIIGESTWLGDFELYYDPVKDEHDYDRYVEPLTISMDGRFNKTQLQEIIKVIEDLEAQMKVLKLLSGNNPNANDAPNL